MIPNTARQLIDHTAFECLVLVSLVPEKLNSAKLELTSNYSIGDNAIGRDLSAYLMSQNINNRGQLSENWLFGQMGKIPNKIALCWNIDLLFDPSLNLDPLVLFRQAGRRNPTVVLWPGTFTNGILSYAIPEHRHYRIWTAPEARICQIE